MQKLLQLILILLLVLLSHTTYAGNDCDQGLYDDCIGGSGVGVNQLYSVVVIIVGGSMIIGELLEDEKDPDNYARLLTDYQRGNGYRLTSYENQYNVSVFSINKTDQSKQFKFAHASLNEKPSLTIDLVKVTREF